MVRLTFQSTFDDDAGVFEASIDKLTRFDRPVGAKGRPPLSLWDRMGDSWRRSRVRMFDTQGAAAGTPWLTYEETEERDQYVAYKSGALDRPVTARDVLRWPNTDYLYFSFVDRTNPMCVDQRQPTTAEFGSRLPYAINHDLGIGYAPRIMGGHPIQRRPLTALGPWLRRQWEDDLLEYAIDYGAALGQQLSGAQAKLLPLATS